MDLFNLDEKEKLELMRKSFFGVYYFMIFAFTVTLICCFIVKETSLRRILIIEVLVTGISSFMYYLFTNNIDTYFSTIPEPGRDIDLSVVDRLRYNGWAFSTPLMLIALCLILSTSTKVPINPIMMFTILLLDYIMLLLGYLGEVDMIDHNVAMVLGFIPFFMVFYLIFSTFLTQTINPFNYLIFFIYFIIWAGYGVAYGLDEKIKNIVTNVFDAIAKGVVAILLSFAYISF